MRKVLRWAAVAAALGLGAPARAQSDESRREAAKALIAQGGSLYSARDYVGALARFRAAYEMLPNPKIFFNIGQAELRLGHTREAANAFSAFLDQTLPSEALAQQRSVASDQLAKLNQRLARIRVEPQPVDAKVTIDGEPVQGPATFVSPGTHAVLVSAPGYASREEQVTVRASENRRVPVALQAAAPAPAVVPSHPADVPPAVASAAPAPAAHVEAAPAAAVRAEPPPAAMSGRRVAGWALVGGGAAAVVGSGVVGALALSDNDKLAKLAGGDAPPGAVPSDAPGLRSRVRGESWVSTVALGVGLVAAGVGTWLLLTDTPAAGAGGGLGPDGLHFEVIGR